jgi:hypothetical protein
MRWVVETLNPTVDAEIGALPADMRARFVRFANLIEEIGFEALPRDSVKHLEDGLWELRMTRARRHLARHLRDGTGQARGDPARLHQEDAEDAAARTRTGTAAGQRGQMRT